MENQTVTPNQPVQQPAPQQTAPAGQLKTNRGLLKFILLNIITLGIIHWLSSPAYQAT